MEQFFLPLLLLALAIPLFLSARKQKKAVQQQQDLQKALTEGDRVMTTSGLYATVVDISDDTTIVLEIADGVETTWLRQAVREKVGPDVPDDEDEDEIVDEVDENDESERDVDDDTVEETTSDDAKPTEAEVAPSLEHGKSKN